MENLPSFLEKFCSNPTKLWSASKKNGAPHTIVVTGAGLRAADLARTLRKLQTKDAEVAKLFAKHIKIGDSIKFLKSKRTGMAVGTPKRLEDLMDDGALQVDRLERIIVDASHIDQKKRGVLEMRETLGPLVHWLNRKELKWRYDTTGKDKIDLIFF
jgi:protein CMS1